MNYNNGLLKAEFLQFIGAGSFAALVNFLSRIFLSFVFNYVTAIVLAYLIGMITAYLLCRFLIFTPKKNTTVRQIFYFSFINLFAILQTIIVSIFLVNYGFVWIADLPLRETCAHLIGISVPVFSSYLGHKYFTFQ